MTDAVARTKMLIRSPVADVFDAFVNPDKITKFWLNATTGPLAKGAQVEWSFMVPGVRDQVKVTAFDAPRRIDFDWSDGIHVNMNFEPRSDRATVLEVQTSGFTGDDLIDQIVNTTEGYSIVLCDLKTFLESGKSAHLVKDKAELIAAS
jgi:uncharacterized protein YndB with AHSA1/START domain